MGGIRVNRLEALGLEYSRDGQKLTKCDDTLFAALLKLKYEQREGLIERGGVANDGVDHQAIRNSWV